MDLPRGYLSAICLCAATSLIAGCRSPRAAHDPEFAEVVASSEFAISAATEEALVAALAPVADDLAGPQPVEVYIRHALAQNPDIQAARHKVDALAARVPQAASLQDPMFGVTVFPEPIQTAAGQQELSLVASQKVPWPGKLGTRAAMAEAEADVARAGLVAAEWQVVEEVKRAYYDLYFYQQAIRITEQDRILLDRIATIVRERLRTPLGSQHDVWRAELEVLNLDNQLIRLRQQRTSAQARLARMQHISPDTPLAAVEQLPPEEIPHELDRLYAQAIAGRPELHAQLAAVSRDQFGVELARLNYYPDPTFAVTWIDTAGAGISPVTNGRDAVLLGVNMNVPIYRKRLVQGVREAQAQATATARRYDSLRDRTLQDVKDLFVKASSQAELIELFRTEIIPTADATYQASVPAYEVGKIDFLQLIDNWRGLLRFELAEQRLESELRQTIATLERVVGGRLAQGPTPPHKENR